MTGIRSNNGDFEVYDISNNQLTSAAPMGQVGMEWSSAGIAADPPGGANAQLAQAMASFASCAGPLGDSSSGGALSTQIVSSSPFAANAQQH